jgi:porin
MRVSSRRFILATTFSLLLTTGAAVRAGHEIAEEEEAPEPHAWMLGDWGGLRTRMGERGIYLWLDYTGEVLGNPAGGRRRGAAYEGAFDAGIEIELEPLIGWKGASISATGNYSHGPVYSERYIGDLSGVSTIESYDTIRLLELWFEQKVEVGAATLSLRLGSQALDAEFWQNAHQSLLINNTFGTPPVASGNFPIPSYALAALGARFAAVIGKPSEHAALFQFGVFDGNPASGILPDPTPGTPESTDFNKHGTNWALRSSEGALFIGETGFTFNQPTGDAPDNESEEEEEGKAAKQIAKPERGPSGTYRLGVIHHTDRFADVYDATLLDADQEIGRKQARSVRGNTAIYATLDQEIWRETGSDSEGLSVFGRAAVAPKRQNRIDYSWEAGVHYLGLLPGRAQDQLALGFGLTHINSRVAEATQEANRRLSRRTEPAAAREVKQAERDLAAIEPDPEDLEGTQDEISEALAGLGAAWEDLRAARREDEINRSKRTGIPDYEAVLELTYRAQITPWFTLQPDVQWVIRPGATGVIDDALVLGLRANVAF